MEALIAFAGIALGWVLAEVSERRRTHADGRVAATLVTYELMQARELLRMATEQDGLLPQYPATVAWETYAPTLLRWRADQLALPVLKAYSGVSSDVAVLQWLDSERRNALVEVKELPVLHSEEDVAGMGEREREHLRARLELAILKKRTLDSSLSTYLESVSASTLPAIDAAVEALSPFANV